MVVEYDDKITNTDKIINSVIDIGYGATLHESKENGKSKKEIKNSSVYNDMKSMKHRLIISLIFWIPLMYVAMYHMFKDWFGIPIPSFIMNMFHGTENSLVFAFTQFLLLLPILYVNRNYFISGFKKLFKGMPNMDSLIAIGSSAATIYGIVAIYMIGYGLGHNNIEIVQNYASNLYFESAGTILTLITVGKYLETKSKGKTSDAISKLINLAPKTAVVVRDGKEIEVGIEEIVKDDEVIIKPGESIGIDGVIIEGEASIDQSSITGESIPVYKKVGDKVVSGTINKNGYIKIRATNVGDDTTLSQIIKLVEEASNSKAPISKIADKVSSVFVPIVITIAILAVIVWLLAGYSFEFALSIGISVLVISCPCALGLATPVAIMVGTGKGAENGILIKSAESLEILHSVDTVVLDKTGTITEGKPKVTDIVSLINENELLKIAGSLEKSSEHPLAEAIVKKAEDSKIIFNDVKKFETVSGRGVKGVIEQKTYFAGNIAFMKENNINTEKVNSKAKDLLNRGKTVLYFSDDKNVIGIIAVADTIKKTSYQAIKVLKKRNIDTIMITGDNSLVANSIGNEIGINRVISEVLPQDKEREIDRLQKEGKKVAFVGDGINDSPALVRSDVGLAIGSGTDIAIESADCVIIKNSLLDVVAAIDLSKSVIRNIKLSLFWAFIYNIIGIPVACGILYPAFGITLSPMIGAACMSLSSVCVVTNALRLKRFKPHFKINDCNDGFCNNSLEKNNIEINKEEKLRMEKLVSIEGMSCNHCKMNVEKALKEIDGVEEVNVSLEEKNAIIKLNKEVSDSEIKNAIQEAGYAVIEIK